MPSPRTPLTRSAGIWENDRYETGTTERKGVDAMKVKFLLKDSEIPKTWYNIMADMPNPPEAVLHTGTGKPVGPADRGAAGRGPSQHGRGARGS